MALRPVEAIWFWRYTTAPFRAAYGRLGAGYTKDYLQTSGECSETFDRVFGRVGLARYDITYSWPGGQRSDVIKPGGGYHPPDDRRLNFRWPYSDSPEPWRLFSTPGPLAAFPGDPTQTTAAAADAVHDQFMEANYEPWLLAVKLTGEAHVLHVRAYMGNPPSDRLYASTSNLPPLVRGALSELGRAGCGTYEPDPAIEPLRFDPERVFDAWDQPQTKTTPEVGLVLSGEEDDAASGLYVFAESDAALAVAGRPFIYYAGGSDQGRYVGVGVLGEGREELEDVIAVEVIAYRAFQKAIPATSASGNPYEPQASEPGHYANPVRTIPLAQLEAIVGQALLSDDADAVVVAKGETTSKAYASSELARKIDAYAMHVAVEEVAKRFPGHVVKRMPHNNPGYDVRVSAAGVTVRYVEVKGTRGDRGLFFISEGERQFSQAMAALYSLIVVRSVDLDKATHETLWYDGAVEATWFTLRVRQWQGEVPD